MRIIHILCIILLFGFSLNVQTTNQTQILSLNEIEDGKCMVKCLQCQSGPNSCTKCSEGSNCCNWACSRCQNQVTCKACRNDFVLDQKLNICVFSHSCSSPLCLDCDKNTSVCLVCYSGYYLNTQMLTCDACPPKCLACVNSYSCQVCSARTFWQDGACRPCAQNCDDCHNATSCDNCTQSFYPNQNRKCQKCMQSCKNCTSKRDCQQCLPGHFYDQTIKQCVPCSRPCALCQSSTQCITCEANHFFNKTTNQCQDCSQIHPHCVICQLTTNTISLVSDNEVICKSCDTKYFVTQSKTCKSCLPNCMQCKDDLSCNLCAQSYFVNDRKQCQYCTIFYCMICNSTSCIICQPGYYYNPEVAKTYCVKCTSGCESCDQFGCIHCAYGYYEKNGNCYKCDSSCLRCVNSASNCTTCLNGYFKISFTTGSCAKCPQPCSQCKNITSCTRCFPGFYLSKNICKKCSIQGCDLCRFTPSNLTNENLISKFGQQENIQIPQASQKCIRCASGYNLINQRCEKCIEGCQKCTDNKKCILCYRGYFINPEGTKCSKCNQNCNSCQYVTNQLSLCLVCNDGFHRDVGNQNCLPCLSNCKFCIETNSDICIDCKEGHYMKFVNQTNQICQKCTAPCKTCEAEKECLSCITGYYLNLKDVCIKCQQGCQQCNQDGCFICQVGYRLQFSSLTCEKCKVQKCSKCQQSQDKCDTCEDGYKHFTPQPKDKISDSSSIPVCYRCDQSMEGCKSCDSPVECSQCFNGLTLGLTDDGSTSVCQKVSNLVGFVITIGILALIILILTGVICFLRFRKSRSDKKSTKSEHQKLIQRNDYSINSEEIIESGPRKSVMSSFSQIG